MELARVSSPVMQNRGVVNKADNSQGNCPSFLGQSFFQSGTWLRYVQKVLNWERFSGKGKGVGVGGRVGSTDVSLGVLLLAYIFYLLADWGLWNKSKWKKVKAVCVFNFHY